MAGIDGVRGASPVTIREAVDPQGTRIAQARTGKQAVLGDQFRPSIRNSGNSTIFGPVLKDIFRTGAGNEAADMVESVLQVQWGNRGNFCGTPVMMELMWFDQRVKSAIIDTLKGALNLLKSKEASFSRQLDELGINGDSGQEEAKWSKMWLESDLGLVRGMRKTVEDELQARSKQPADKARRMIDAVVDSDGAEQLEAYVKFGDKLKTVSDTVLEHLRDQLIDSVANESDHQQRLIYKLLLHAVNKEMDRRRPLPVVFPAHVVPATSLQLSVEEHRLLKARLTAAEAHTQAAVKSMVGIEK